jgi:hypothetical protein
MRFFAVLCILATCASAFCFTLIFQNDASAVQQASLAAVGCGIAIIPYILMRSIQVLLAPHYK